MKKKYKVGELYFVNLRVGSRGFGVNTEFLCEEKVFLLLEVVDKDAIGLLDGKVVYVSIRHLTPLI